MELDLLTVEIVHKLEGKNVSETRLCTSYELAETIFRPR
jgi:hypothetical protein